MRRVAGGGNNDLIPAFQLLENFRGEEQPMNTTSLSRNCDSINDLNLLIVQRLKRKSHWKKNKSSRL